MSPTFRAIIHIAGAPDPDGFQRCLICRFELAAARHSEDPLEKEASWWDVGQAVTQIGSGPDSYLWAGDNQGHRYSHIRCSRFAEGMEEIFGFQLHPGDWLFEESHDAGDPRCLCSRCHKPIDEETVPIRIFVPGYTDREYRFHPDCIGLTAGPAGGPLDGAEASE